MLLCTRSSPLLAVRIKNARSSGIFLFFVSAFGKITRSTDDFLVPARGNAGAGGVLKPPSSCISMSVLLQYRHRSGISTCLGAVHPRDSLGKAEMPFTATKRLVNDRSRMSQRIDGRWKGVSGFTKRANPYGSKLSGASSFRLVSRSFWQPIDAEPTCLRAWLRQTARPAG